MDCKLERDGNRGTDPGHTDYNSFADFADADGNTWILQEVKHTAG